MDNGENFSDVSTEADVLDGGYVSVAEHAYDYLLTVVEEEGQTIANGIIILRTIDKIFDAWNGLLIAGNFEDEAYTEAALRAVAATNSFNERSIYHLTAKAIADIFNICECSLSTLSEISTGVERMRSRTTRALESEQVENGKANIIKSMTTKLTVIERDYTMRETLDNVQLSFATGPMKIIADGRGNRSNHNSVEWTDEHRLTLLELYRDNPDATHQARARMFNHRHPGVDRSREAMRQERARLTKTCTTIRDLQAKLGRGEDESDTVTALP